MADQLRADREMSQDDLAYEARKYGAPSALTGSYISAIKKGRRPLSIEVLGGLAGALEVEPETFAEYRLAQARQQLDERQVGLEQAVENLRRLEAAEAAAGTPILPALDPQVLQRGSASPAKAQPGSPASTKQASPPQKRSAKKRAA